MGVAGQILKYMFRPAEWRFGVNDPILSEESAQECCECFLVRQRSTRSVEDELILVKGLSEPSDELPAKDTAKHSHWQEKLRW